MISDNIKALRMQKGMTQKTLADMLHVTPQAVSRWENGDVEPSVDTISEIATIFEVTIDEIVNGSDKKNETEKDVITAQQPQQEKIIYVEIEQCNLYKRWHSSY